VGYIVVAPLQAAQFVLNSLIPFGYLKPFQAQYIVLKSNKSAATNIKRLLLLKAPNSLDYIFFGLPTKK